MLHATDEADEMSRSGLVLEAEAGIHFVCRGVDYRFTEPNSCPEGLSKVPGIYAVLVADENCSPSRLRVLYFGQTDDLSSAVTRGSSRYTEWLRRARNRPLRVSVHVLPATSSETERRDLELGFIAAYQPICNQGW
jgi:hypothetical protein